MMAIDHDIETENGAPRLQNRDHEQERGDNDGERSFHGELL
jgi:hypothetical protein